MNTAFKYDQRGVSATKSEVHAAIKHLDKGLYPNAFCKILPDLVAGDQTYCNLMHADTAGTKTSLAYLYWKETGDLSVWKGVTQDSIVMNLDDMGCVGCINNIILSSTIGRNKNIIPGSVISTIINGTSEFIASLKSHGIQVTLAGGETADVGDIVRTIDIGYTAFGRMKRSEVIRNNIQPGNVIVGLASYGQATYESEYNGGMGSNGLTSARHDVLEHSYANKYPDSYDPNTPKDLVYIGSKKLTDTIEINGQEITVGKLILSPTRTYLPIIKVILDKYKGVINGMIHNTGGGQTKVIKFVDKVRVVKDNLFDLPPLFELIQSESGTGWKEMYQVFNMGHRLEIYTDEKHVAGLIEIAESFGVAAKVIGYVEAAKEKEVLIKSAYGTFTYNE